MCPLGTYSGSRIQKGNYRINILKIWVNKNDFFRVYLKDYSNPCDDFKSVFSGLKIDDYH